jgi:hypothetical protein
MRPGLPPRSKEEAIAAGETRPSRHVVTLFADHAERPDPEVINPPPGMTPAGRKIWKEKVERYRQRGQKIQGFENSLRQFCELEATLNESWKHGTTIMSMVNAHRMWCAEFFDTPASQRVPASSNKRSENKFASNGKAAASGA